MNAADRIADNLAQVRQRIHDAAQRAGREPDEVTLVAVTKYVDAATTRLLVEAGCTDLGESRPQQLHEKAPALDGLNVRWHLVGHLQRNKIRRTLPCTTLIHSVDSEALLLAIDRIAGELEQKTIVLIEVNVSADEAKHGLSETEIPALLDVASRLAHVQVDGLMAMASFSGGEEVARKNFASLRQLRDRLLPNRPAGVALDQLSMGMSGDYEVAIEEGATIVRVGSALFEGLD